MFKYFIYIVTPNTYRKEGERDKNYFGGCEKPK